MAEGSYYLAIYVRVLGRDRLRREGGGGRGRRRIGGEQGGVLFQMGGFERCRIAVQ